MSTVAVVGGTRGIGAQIVRDLLSSTKHKVITLSRSVIPDAGYELPNSTRVSHVRCDLSGKDLDRESLTDSLGEQMVTHLIVCAGSGMRVATGSYLTDLEVSVARNLAPFLNALELFKDEIMSQSGSITAVSSIAAWGIQGAPIEYVATKAALNAYVKALAKALSPARVNAIAPGNVLTENSPWSKKEAEEPELLEAYLQQSTALGRLGTPTEISGIARFLLSDEASFVTGSVWVADGGQLSSR